jgi:hypothetical protein
MIRFIGVCLAVALLPLRVAGQASPDSVKFRNDCRLATQVVTTGHPAVKTDWAMTIIRECPAVAGALARALAGARSSTDTVELTRITNAADWLRDGSLFAAAYDLLGDRAASHEARIFGVRVLMWAFLPGTEIRYSHLVAIVDGDGVPICAGLGPSLHGDLVIGTPLPPDWAPRAQHLGRTIALDPTEPVRVRQAARCLALAIPYAHLRNLP